MTWQRQPASSLVSRSADYGLDRADAKVYLRIDASALGSVLLGGNRWSELAAVGRIMGDVDAVRRADVMFAWSPAPAMLSTF